MEIRTTFVLLLLAFFTAQGQTQIEVPDQIYFAGMKLTLSKSLRANIASQIATIQKNKTYFQAKVSLADMYFPIIERVFTEEDIPLDFKYLAIQESSLQSDVVSTSNAVGYWQFKKESATEVGVIVNNEVDERKHIVESSRGAARYLKKNYLVTTNWLYALIAYNTGLGGAKAFIKSKYVGANEMDLEDDMHWYAAKFIAHKLAYEDKVGYIKPELALLEYSHQTKGKPLSKIAKETDVAEDKIANYNKWALSSKVPEDKNSIVILPIPYADRETVAAKLGIDLSNKGIALKDPATTNFVISAKPFDKNKPLDEIFLFTTNNGLDGVIARETDNVAKLAFAGRVSIERFLKYNELERFEEVKAGQIYYFESKNGKALIPFHTVKAGESIWEIAQVYGMKTWQLKNRNRMESGEALQEGRLLYLRFNRPSKEAIIIAEKPKEALLSEAVIMPIVNPAIKKDTIKTAVATITVVAVNINTLPAVLEPIIPTPITKPLTNYSGIDASPKKDSIVSFTLAKLDFTLPDSSFAYHLVNQGQTLYSLSRYYGVKTDTLKAWNKIGAEGIKYNQKLIVSKNSASLKSRFSLITIKSGQDLASLAAVLGTTTEKIMQWNDKKSTAVFVGEILKVKSPIKPEGG